MKPLRHPSDFLDLAARNACSRAAARACREGNYSPALRVTLPGRYPGWRFTVTSLSGSKWLFFIDVDEKNRKYRVRSWKIK